MTLMQELDYKATLETVNIQSSTYIIATLATIDINVVDIVSVDIDLTVFIQECWSAIKVIQVILKFKKVSKQASIFSFLNQLQGQNRMLVL